MTLSKLWMAKSPQGPTLLFARKKSSQTAGTGGFHGHVGDLFRTWLDPFSKQHGPRGARNHHRTVGLPCNQWSIFFFARCRNKPFLFVSFSGFRWFLSSFRSSHRYKTICSGCFRTKMWSHKPSQTTLWRQQQLKRDGDPRKLRSTDRTQRSQFGPIHCESERCV